jgi:hypothetical protein
MSRVELSIAGDGAFRPGEEVTGHASWEIDGRLTGVVVRLYWRTSGQGTADLAIVAEERFAAPAGRDRRPFRFRLPAEPYSFAGKLVTLGWGVEVVAQPMDAAAHQEIVVSPTGRVLTLAALPEE